MQEEVLRVHNQVSYGTIYREYHKLFFYSRWIVVYDTTCNGEKIFDIQVILNTISDSR